MLLQVVLVQYNTQGDSRSLYDTPTFYDTVYVVVKAKTYGRKDSTQFIFLIKKELT
jgi:hypothetical protein